MTYAEYRRWGYRSQLARLRCGGPSKDTINTQNQLTQAQINNANQQFQVSQDQLALAREDRAKMEALQAPLIARETALATGDPKAALAASMPTISKLSAGYAGARESILNQVPPGAARDTALANLEIQKDTGIAGAQASAVQAAPEVLANIGSGQGAFSLQELGASLSGLSGSTSSFGSAGQANVQAGQLEAQRSAALWGPILGLAGIAGNLATGGVFGSIFSSKPKTGGFGGFGTYGGGEQGG